MDLITILFVGGALFIIADSWEGKPKVKPDVVEPLTPESSKPEGLEPEEPQRGSTGWVQLYSTPYGGEPPKMWSVAYNTIYSSRAEEIYYKPTDSYVTSTQYLVIEISNNTSTLLDSVGTEQEAVDLAQAQYDETQLGPSVDPDKGYGPIGGGMLGGNNSNGQGQGGNPYGAGGPIN